MPLEDSDMHERKLRDITPRPFLSCGLGACPSIFQAADGHYLIVGKRMDPGSVPEGRVGHDEIVVSVPAGLLNEARLGKPE